MRNLTPSRAVLLALGVVLVLAPFWAGPLLGPLTNALAKAMVVLGVVLLLRADLVSFGHGLYYALGAYTAALALRNGFPIRDALVLAVLGTLVAIAVAAIVGLFLSRYRGIFFGMLSTAFTMILYSLLVKLYAFSGGTDGLPVRPSTIAFMQTSADTLRPLQFYLVLALAAVSVFVSYRVAASPLGYLMRAIYDNEIRVEYMGASVRRTIYRTYILTGALGGLGGALAGVVVGHVVPEYAYWTQSGEFVFIALLGGTGSVLAPVIGAIVFEFVRYYAFKFSPYSWQMTLGTVLLVIIFFAPGGLWSIFEKFGRGRRPESSVPQPEGGRRWALSWKR